MRLFSKKISWVLLLAGVLAGCDSVSVDDDNQVFVVEAGGGETFRIKITDPVVAAQAEQLLDQGVNKIVHGPIVAGDGGFNAPYSWHLDPEQITFPDQTIELCDGRPSYIEDDLDYWLNNVEVFCPWGAQIVGME